MASRKAKLLSRTRSEYEAVMHLPPPKVSKKAGDGKVRHVPAESDIVLPCQLALTAALRFFTGAGNTVGRIRWYLLGSFRPQSDKASGGPRGGGSFAQHTYRPPAKGICTYEYTHLRGSAIRGRVLFWACDDCTRGRVATVRDSVATTRSPRTTASRRSFIPRSSTYLGLPRSLLSFSLYLPLRPHPPSLFSLLLFPLFLLPRPAPRSASRVQAALMLTDGSGSRPSKLVKEDGGGL